MAVRKTNYIEQIKPKLPQIFFKKRIHFLLHVLVGAKGNVHGMRPQWQTVIFAGDAQTVEAGF